MVLTYYIIYIYIPEEIFSKINVEYQKLKWWIKYM